MRLAGVALLATLALVAAGCGGSSSSESAADETTAIESTATDTTIEDTTETVSTEAETVTTETASTDVDTDDLAKLLGSEGCAELASVGMKFAEAMGASQGSSGDLEDTKKYFDELADKAPEEIRDDFATLAEAWTAIVEVYSDLGIKPGETPSADDIAKLSAAGEELSKKLDNAKFEQASENISKWANENCTAVGNG